MSQLGWWVKSHAVMAQDARLPLPRLQSMYTEMIVLIRKLYQECRLVHGDLSEYNILVNKVRSRGLKSFGQAARLVGR